ncbi:phasin family protein [Rhizorhabdus phycosphaerae]|uniref:phasin family protein n=1 Tax=Rhizorhabdus phycosphaerae TaxID=2711156 RepID=UPI001D009E6B|nr:phasin family protein [Rhizorhabdus phycosphaerae]
MRQTEKGLLCDATLTVDRDSMANKITRKTGVGGSAKPVTVSVPVADRRAAGSAPAKPPEPAIVADAGPVAKGKSAAAATVAGKQAAPAPVAKAAAAVSVKSAPVPAPAAPSGVVAKPAPAASTPEKKGVPAMATTVQPQPKAAAEKVKFMMSDFNDRAKAAFEKTAKAGEEIAEFTKGNMEALATSAKTAAKGAEVLGQDMAEYGKKSFETATATMKSMATVKTPTELFQLQSDYAKSAFDGAVAQASKLTESWLKLAGEVMQPLSSRAAIAAEKIKSASL